MPTTADATSADLRPAPNGAARTPLSNWHNEHTQAKMRALVAMIRRDLSQIARDGARTVREEIASYANVPASDLEASVLRNIERVVNTLLEGQAPRPEAISEAWVAAQRCEQGVAIEDVLQAYRISLRRLRDFFLEYASDLRIDPADVTRGTYLLWETNDIVTLQMARHHREFTIERALHDERQRVNFVRSLFFGNLDHAELMRLAAIYRLSMTSQYHAVHARPHGGTSLNTLRSALELSGGSISEPALVCVTDDAVVGLLSHKPQLQHSVGTAGLGPRLPLEAADTSFQSASRNLDAALRLQRAGCHSLADLSWRIAVVSEPELGSILVDRYLRPLQAHGEFGEQVLETVLEYVNSGRHLGQAARRLHLHVNSLRHRLQRFEQITGSDLDDPDVLVELLWAFEAANVGRLGRTPTDRHTAPGQPEDLYSTTAGK